MDVFRSAEVHAGVALRFIFLQLILLFCLSSCREDRPAPPPIRPTDSTARKPDTVSRDTRPVFAYRLLVIEGRHTLDTLKAQFGDSALALVLKLNRKDRPHVRKNDSLVIPDRFANFMDYSPYPQQISTLTDIPKILFINQRVQAFAAYEQGRLVRWGPVSTGKKSTKTANGLFHTNWRSRKRASTVDSEWILEWYYNLHNLDGVSLHQYEMPGYPASHSCVRLFEDDARWIYDWAYSWLLSTTERHIVDAQGTPVIIFSDYVFGQPKPWKHLLEDPQASHIPQEEIDAALQPHLEHIRKELYTRDSVISVRTQIQAAVRATDSSKSRER